MSNPIGISSIHHLAIICSNYEVSKKFYTEILGFKIINETYRKDRDSYKLDLAIDGTYCIELFSFPSPPKRPSRPEACGLRHLAFGVEDLEKSIQILQSKNVITEAVRIDELTGKKFCFFQDPDALPIELYAL